MPLLDTVTFEEPNGTSARSKSQVILEQLQANPGQWAHTSPPHPVPTERQPCSPPFANTDVTSPAVHRPTAPARALRAGPSST